MMFSIYVDMDGVLVDLASNIERTLDIVLDTRFRHSTERNPEVHEALCAIYDDDSSFELFRTAPKMPGSDILWEYLCLHTEPKILSSTGPLYPDRIREEKIQWIKEHLGDSVSVNTVTETHYKALFVEPNAILIDDQPAALDPWCNAGGVGILHTGVVNTIKQLQSLGL